MKIHIHKWEVLRRGSWNSLIPGFTNTIFICRECGNVKKKFIIKNYRKAGWTVEEFDKEINKRTL